jgi:molybdopterin synthase sulfur carrier subunit
MIHVDVRLYGPLRQVFPDVGLGEQMEVELPDGATVGQLVEMLQLPADQVKVIFVNHTVREHEHTLEDGDRVAVFPPVGGG